MDLTRKDNKPIKLVKAAWSLGFTFGNFSSAVDVVLERLWVKKNGEENNLKSKAQTKTSFSFGTQILCSREIYFGSLFIGSFQ